MSKKIVIIALHLGTGGTERVVCNIANLLSENNSVKIISTYKLGNSPAFNLNNNIQIEYLIKELIPNKSNLIKYLKKFNILNFFKELIKSIKILYLRKVLMIKAIKKLDCDIVISTRIFHNRLVGKYINKNTIKIAQEHNHHNNNQKYIKQLISSLKNFDYFMPVSKELYDFYKPILNPNTKVIYIPNFIGNLPSKQSTLESKQLISVGRLEKVKGFDELIDIFNVFQKSHPDWTLHIVGEGTEKPILQNKINKLNLNQKIFLRGNKLSNELEKEYLNSCIYLMTSFSESFGLVLVEAASFGLPLIAFDSAKGAKEIIENGKNGFLIPDRNKEIFIEKLNEVIENHKEKNNFSSYSLCVANKFSKNNVVQMWNNFINSL